MAVENRYISGAVLAGGQSQRFGQDKALARLGSNTLLDRTLEVLSVVTTNPMVIGRPPYPDLRPGLGPLAGLETALTLLPEKTTHLVLLAVDMPGITTDFIRILADAPDADAVVPFHAERLHPLCARWHRRVLPIVKETLNSGARSMHSVLERLDIQPLTTQALQAKGIENPDRVLFNVNAQDDLNTFLEQRNT
jgi:molybdopterin-guanine dinucleotide biosynthesis protein A